MDKIFAKTAKTLLYGLVSPPSPSKLICKNWDPSLFLLYDVKLHGKKKKKLMIQRSCIPGKWEKE